jgi:glycosyltransferase involved in cell wall biosynthesis
MISISANILVLNEVNHIDDLIKNLMDADLDEIIFLDGGSTDGSWEKILFHAKNNKKVIPISWPQRGGSEYKSAFNEVFRRNLMIQASSSDYILYVDADERVSLGFKSQISNDSHIIAAPRTSYWAGLIRENGPNDKVWNPDISFRIFKRTKLISFSSKDKNGLHTYLKYRGIKIPHGANRGKFFKFIATFFRLIIGVRLQKEKCSIRIFHYHYYDVNVKKVNDLRKDEFEWPIEIDCPVENRTYFNKVYASSEGQDPVAIDIRSQYYFKSNN